MKSSVKKELPHKSTPNWRQHQDNFVNNDVTDIIEPGAVTFSAGWLGQGHTVSCKHDNPHSFFHQISQTDDDPLLPSRNLRVDHHIETSNWLKMSNEVEKFLNLTLSLIHPDLFEMGLKMLQILQELEDTEHIANQWQSVYTGIQVICNRITPPHRDSKGRPEWYDILANYSEVGALPRLVIEDIGLDLEYGSGTVVGFCGSIFQHGVDSWGDGDRICYAHFMRESVRKRLKVPAAGWVKRSNYLPSETPINPEDDEITIDVQSSDDGGMDF